MLDRGQAQKKLEIPAKWYAVRVEDNAFTVEMPGIPDHHVIDDVSARGTAFACIPTASKPAAFPTLPRPRSIRPMSMSPSRRRVLQASLDDRAQQLAGRKWDRRSTGREIDAGAAVESTGTVRAGRCCACSRS